MKLLASKVFNQHQWPVHIPPDTQTAWARQALANGGAAGRGEIKALAKAKLRYVEDVLRLFGEYGGRAFASIVDRNAPYPAGAGLRKDYAYLFQRFFYFFEDRQSAEQGLIVFDEIERSESHLLINQTQEYFRRTQVGRDRARQIIPEPLFVSSDLTTGIQIADLIAYCLAWAYRAPGMTGTQRYELQPYIEQILPLRYRMRRNFDGDEHTIGSFTPPITDLRPQHER